MWKLTFNLCVLIFVTLVIAGRDHLHVGGEDVAQASKAQSSVLDLVAPTTVASIERTSVADEAFSDEPTPSFWQVRSTRINVRGGPSTSNDVLAKLTKGEEVLIVEDNGDGWSKIRIEGDGIEGWVATSLLVPSE